MKLNHVAIAAVAVIALSLSTAFAGHADTTAMPNFTIQTIHGDANHVFDVRNDGTVTAGSCWIKLSASSGQSWQMPLFPLAPGAVFHVSVPSVINGLNIQLTLDVDCGKCVPESIESDNVATTTYLAPLMPNLTIVPLYGQANKVFDIHNDGTVASGFCWIKLSASNGRVWQMPLFPLAPGAVFHVSMPAVTDLNLSVTLEVDYAKTVIESNESDNIASTTYLAPLRYQQ